MLRLLGVHSAVNSAMVLVVGLQRHGHPRNTRQDVCFKFKRIYLQICRRRGSLNVLGAVALRRNSKHCPGNSSSARRVLRATAAAATPETSVTLLRTAIIILCMCASFLCIATIFLVKKLMHTARKVEETLDIVNEELPGLSASARLTGLELADCIVEFSHLGQEVTGGLKAGARAMQATEASLQQGGEALKHTWKNHIAPGISERITASQEILDYSLRSNAGLTYADNTPAQMAATTKVAIQEARKMVAAMGALYQVASKALGLLTYVSQSQAGEGIRADEVRQRAGPAASTTVHEQSRAREQNATVNSSGTWPDMTLQQEKVVRGEGPKIDTSPRSTTQQGLSGDKAAKPGPEDSGYQDPPPPQLERP